MSDPETPSQPLLNQQTAVDVGASAQGHRSSSRAYTVAGLTVLACVLIAGQVAIGYLLYSQGSDIRDLQEQHDEMSTELTNGRSGGVVPARMHIPMKTMTEMTDDLMDEEASTGGKTAVPLTSCQQEAAGLKVTIPGFSPKCDKNGLYERQQCFIGGCWCVNPANGDMIPKSLGASGCNASAFSGDLVALSDSLGTENN